MGRGSRRLTTAWIPWHDIPLRTGGVAVVDRSHSLPGYRRVRQTYGEQEVHGMLSSDPLECIGFDPAARWLTADYKQAMCWPSRWTCSMGAAQTATTRWRRCG